MKSSRQVEQIVGQARLQADQATDERILGDARAALASMNNRPQALRPGPAIWRTIMGSKVTRYSVAATIILAASLVLLNPFGRSSVVLGEVAQKLSETRTLMHKESRLAWRPGEDKPFFKAEVRKYFSSDVGMVEEQYDPNGVLIHRICFLKASQEFVIVLPRVKKYVRLPLPDGIYDRFVAMMVPSGLISYFTSQPYTKLGRSHFGDFEVEGFEVPQVDLSWVPSYTKYLFPIRDLTARVLVDVESTLPVAIEMEIDADRGLMNGFQKVHAEFTAYDFEWNAELPAGILDPNIPADYTRIDLGSVASENAAWFGVGALPIVGIVVRKRRSRQTSPAGRPLHADAGDHVTHA